MNTNYWSPDINQNLSFDGSNRVVPSITFHGSTTTSTNLPLLGPNQIPLQYQSIHPAHNMNFNCHPFPCMNQLTTPIMPAPQLPIHHPLRFHRALKIAFETEEEKMKRFRFFVAMRTASETQEQREKRLEKRRSWYARRKPLKRKEEREKRLERRRIQNRKYSIIARNENRRKRFAAQRKAREINHKRQRMEEKAVALMKRNEMTGRGN